MWLEYLPLYIILEGSDGLGLILAYFALQIAPKEVVRWTHIMLMGCPEGVKASANDPANDPERHQSDGMVPHVAETMSTFFLLSRFRSTGHSQDSLKG